jgi:Leu/Phe-tRNA-protein transferase
MRYDDAGYAYIEPGDDFRACAEAMAADGAPEFAVYPVVDADAFESSASAGFMPMGIRVASPRGGMDLLLPKLHLERCLLDPSLTRVTKTARREARKYSLSVNGDFSGVLAACVETHGPDWLVPSLVEAMAALHRHREARRVRTLSVELWRDERDGPALVAGEVGYLIGRAYASLTGFSRASGAGTVQLSALGRLLSASGVRIWDLGMSLPYKLALGARLLPRERFMPLLSRSYGDRSADGGLGLVGASERMPARALIDAPAGYARAGAGASDSACDSDVIGR